MGEGVELALPERPVPSDPASGLDQRRRLQATAMHAAVLRADEKLRAFEHAQMLGDCRQRYGKRFSKLRHRGFTAGQSREDRPASRIG